MMAANERHKWYCFAAQTAPCLGYFPNDVLPCVCPIHGDVFQALRQLLVEPQLLLELLPVAEEPPALLPAA
jgi:hypothetical protein